MLKGGVLGNNAEVIFLKQIYCGGNTL